MAERIEIDFEGDVRDASAAIETMVRLLDRLEGQAVRTGRATDDIGVDLVDDIAEVAALTAAEARLEKQAEATARAQNRIGVEALNAFRKMAGLQFNAGGAGGGGQWGVGGQLALPRGSSFAMGPATPPPSFVRGVTGSFPDIDVRKVSDHIADAFAMGIGKSEPKLRDSIADAIKFANEDAANDTNTRRSWSRMFSAAITSALTGGAGGSGGGGGGRRGGGGFFSYGADDGRFQAGDIARGILPGAGRAGPGALSLLASGAVGLGAIATPAILGSLAAASALLATMGVNAGVLAIALAGTGKAIMGDKDAFDALTPSAQKFVNQIREIIPWAKELRAEIQDRMLPGIAAGFAALTSPAMLGALKTGLGAIATEIGDSIARIGAAFGSADFAGKLGKFLQDSTGWTRNLVTAFISLSDAGITVLASIKPLLDWITQGIAKGSQLADMWIRNRVESGKFAGDMDNMKESIRVLGTALQSVLGFLVSLGDVMSEPVARALKLVGDGLDELARTLQENKVQIRAFIDGGLEAMANVIRGLWPLVKLLASNLNTVANALGGWENAWMVIFGLGIAGKLLLWEKGLYAVGTAAGVAGGEAAAGGLLTKLTLLARLAAVAIAINFVIDGAFGVNPLQYAYELGARLGDAVNRGLRAIGIPLPGNEPGSVPGSSSKPPIQTQDPIFTKTDKWLSNPNARFVKMPNGDVQVQGPDGTVWHTYRKSDANQTAYLQALARAKVPDSKQSQAARDYEKGRAVTADRGQPGESLVAGSPVGTTPDTSLGGPGGGTHSRSERGYVWQDDDAVDIVATESTVVYAVVTGSLSGAKFTPGGGRFGGWGVTLTAEDGADQYFYKHMSTLYVKEGRVSQGQVIGKGTVNGHIHFARKGATTTAEVLGAPITPTTGGGTGTWTGGAGKAPPAATSANTAAEPVEVTALKTEMAHIAKIIPEGLDELEPGLKKRLDAARALFKKLSADGLFSQADAAKVTAALKNLSRDAENSLDMQGLADKVEKAKKDLPRLLAGGFITPEQAKDLTKGFADLAKMKRDFLDPESAGGIVITPAEEAKYRAAAGKLTKAIEDGNRDAALAAAGIKVVRATMQAALKDGILTDEELNAVEDKLKGLKGKIAKGMQAAVDAVQIDRTAFHKAFDEFVDMALKAFDRAHDLLRDALVVAVTFNDVTFSIAAGGMTPAEKELADRAAALERKQITDRIATAKQLLDDARQKEGESQEEWLARRAKLEQDYADELYAQQTYNLEILAGGQRKAADEALKAAQQAFDDKTAADRANFESGLRQIEEDMATNKITYGVGLDKIKALFAEYQVPFGEQAGILGEALQSGLMGAFEKLTAAIIKLGEDMERLLGKMKSTKQQADALASGMGNGGGGSPAPNAPSPGSPKNSGQSPVSEQNLPGGTLYTYPDGSTKYVPAPGSGQGEQPVTSTPAAPDYSGLGQPTLGSNPHTYARGGVIDSMTHAVMGESGPEAVFPIPPGLAAALKARFGTRGLTLGGFLNTVLEGRQGRGVPSFHGSSLGGGGGGQSMAALAEYLHSQGVGSGGVGGGGDTNVNVNVADGMQWLREFITVTMKKNSGLQSYLTGKETDRRFRGGRGRLAQRGRF